MAEPVTEADLRAWCDRRIALLEANIAETRRNQWRQLQDDYELELAHWRAMQVFLTKDRDSADSGTT